MWPDEGGPKHISSSCTGQSRQFSYIDKMIHDISNGNLFRLSATLETCIHSVLTALVASDGVWHGCRKLKRLRNMQEGRIVNYRPKRNDLCELNILAEGDQAPFILLFSSNCFRFQIFHLTHPSQTATVTIVSGMVAER